jgi:threonyl-tRNA synthetase
VVPYAREVASLLEERGLRIEIDERNEKIGAKIRDAQLQKVPYMLIIGDREAAARTVAVRSRSEGDTGAQSLDAFVSMAEGLVREKALKP